MASEQPRAALPGTPWHAVAPIISSILSQNLLVDQIMNVSKSYVKIKNDDEPRFGNGSVAFLSARLQRARSSHMPMRNC